MYISFCLPKECRPIITNIVKIYTDKHPWMNTISQSWSKIKKLCLLQVGATESETQDITSRLDGLYKTTFPKHSQTRITFGKTEAKEHKLILKAYSKNLEDLQDDLLGYCNLTGIYVRNIPDLSALLFYSTSYRNTSLPCEEIPLSAKKTFTNIEIKFRINVKTSLCFSPHYNTESEEEEEPLCLTVSTSTITDDTLCVETSKDHSNTLQSNTSTSRAQDLTNERSSLKIKSNGNNREK